MDHLKSVWKDAPAITRSFTVIPLVLHIAGWRWFQQLNGLKLSLYTFRNQGHYWAVLTSPLWEPPGGVLQLLIVVLMAYLILMQLPRLELAMGSGKLLLWSTAAALAVNLLFLLFAVVLDVLYQALSWESRWPFIPSRGFIPVCVYGFTVSCLASGEDETTLLGIPLKKKYKPLAIVVFYCLVNGFYELPVVAGLALGYVRRLQVEAILPSDGKVQRWERLPVLFFGRQLFGGRWIRITDTCTSRSFAFGEARLPTSSQRAGPPEFRAFGGPGHRLGR